MQVLSLLSRGDPSFHECRFDRLGLTAIQLENEASHRCGFRNTTLRSAEVLDCVFAHCQMAGMDARYSTFRWT